MNDKTSARVIVTYDCDKNCDHCVNNFLDKVTEVSFKDLFNYKEIIITGGEPTLVGPRVVELIHRLRYEGYKGQIWLYTAELNTKRWADKAILKEVDGITYTIHDNYTKKDITLLKRLTEDLKDPKVSANKNNRLLLDSRIEKEIRNSVPDIDLGTWNQVRPIKWRPNGEIHLPDNEVLVYYNIEK